MITRYFITGASSGLGAEMARQLVQRGDTVAAAARRRDLLDELASQLDTAPGTITVHPLDVTDMEAVREVMHHADAVHGGFDVVVVNAGRGGGARLGTGAFDRNRAVIETNLIGAIAQVEAALELFRARGHGHLVLMASIVSSRPLPGGVATYSATKSALASLGRALRTEFAGTETYVSTIRPGYVATDLTERVPSRLKTPAPRAVASIIRAIDDRVAEAVVPAWPWKVVDRLLPLVPDRLVRRFM